jgi:hypothetical protein
MRGWDKYELIEFFGALPEEDEDQTYLSFKVERDGLRLHVSFFHHSFDAYIDIFRDGIGDPVFRTKIENSAGMKYVKYANGRECLEIAAAHGNVSVEDDRLIPAGARVTVKPHLSVEMFRPSAG